MTQLDANDFVLCSFGVANVVVFLIIRIITGNFDIVNTYKCLRSEIALLDYAKLVCLLPIGSKSVIVVECVNQCMQLHCTNKTTVIKHPLTLAFCGNFEM